MIIEVFLMECLCHYFFVAIQVLSNSFVIKQQFQGLVSSSATCRNPAKLTCDPRSHALVTSGRPGHLQFYDIHKDEQLFTVGLYSSRRQNINEIWCDVSNWMYFLAGHCAAKLRDIIQQGCSSDAHGGRARDLRCEWWLAGHSWAKRRRRNITRDAHASVHVQQRTTKVNNPYIRIYSFNSVFPYSCFIL